MQKYPEPIVGGFIFNSEGELFLMKSPKWKNLYVVPGGHIEIGETIEKALRREIKEETRLEISSPKFICIQEFILEEEFYKQKHMLFLNFRVKEVSNKVILSNEANDYIWIKPSEALKLPLEKYTRITIKDLLLKELN